MSKKTEFKMDPNVVNGNVDNDEFKSRSVNADVVSQEVPVNRNDCQEQQLSLYDSIAETLTSALQFIIPSALYTNDDPVGISVEELDNLAIYQPLSQDKHKTKWDVLLNDNNHWEWEQRCKQLLTPSTLSSPLMTMLESRRAKLRAFQGTWNLSGEHCSPNIYGLDDCLTVHRIPGMNRTDGIRGKLGVSRGVHTWAVQFIGPIGSHCSIGIATANAPLLSHAGYMTLIGGNAYSWGWDIPCDNLSHNGKIIRLYPKSFIYKYRLGDIIQMVLNCESGTLSYSVNGKDFDVAFENLPQTIFYPAVSLVYGNMEVSLAYLGAPSNSLLQ